ncbi:Ras family [Pelomyxa schiedti]|nr:Ras family [Pelomyxa schiedti]
MDMVKFNVDEKFRAIAIQYYRDAQGALLVYDTTDKDSFTKLTYWYKELKAHAPPATVIMILGNKSDLNRDAISEDEVQAFLTSVGNPLFKRCSALTGESITEAFTDLCHQIHIVKNNS